MKWMRVAAVALAAVVAAAAATFVLTRETAAPPAARPSPTPKALATGAPSPAPDTKNLSQRLRREAGIEAVAIHLEAFNDIATDNGGTRAAGTPGFDASAAYVADRLREAGYEVEQQEFSFPSYRIHSPPRLERDARRVTANEFKVMLFSPGGTAEGTAVRVGESNPAFAGCTTADFDGFPAGSIAIVDSANCRYRDQAANAEGAGATALLIATRREDAGVGVLRGNLGPDPGVGIPVVGVSYELGRAAEGSRIALEVDASQENADAVNVIAQTGHGRTPVVMLGAHLDSVIDAPGINDNASGSALLLALAEAAADERPRQAIRFAWWGAEEYGLLGSLHYVEALGAPEREEIGAYLNFDMVGSPNFVRYVYEGEDEPEGSAALEAALRRWFDRRNLPIETIPLEGRSDHAAFSAAGIPVGGLFTGANMLKTRAEVKIYGGSPGIAEDPCYHLACDDIDNVDRRVLRQMSAAVATTVGDLAMRPAVLP